MVGQDLPPGDQDTAILAHCEVCEGCRGHVEQLERGLDALREAAFDSPTTFQAPVWPVVRARMRVQRANDRRLRIPSWLPVTAMAAASLLVVIASAGPFFNAPNTIESWTAIERAGSINTVRGAVSWPGPKARNERILNRRWGVLPPSQLPPVNVDAMTNPVAPY